MFEPFPKLTRFSHDWTITEKIDGTNAQILIVSDANPDALPLASEEMQAAQLGSGHGFGIYAGSRNRFLTVGKGDNHSFAQFVQERAPELISTLGEGRHYGEWYGGGIGPRQYGLSKGEKRFALFNASRWTGVELPDRVDVVPVLYQGYLEQSRTFDDCLEALRIGGSHIAPGFMNPEGIVMYHGPSRTLFKRTFEYDELGKWAENQERKA